MSNYSLAIKFILLNHERMIIINLKQNETSFKQIEGRLKFYLLCFAVNTGRNPINGEAPMTTSYSSSALILM